MVTKGYSAFPQGKIIRMKEKLLEGAKNYQNKIKIIRTYLCVYVCACVCVWVSVYVCICVCMCMCIWVCKCIFMYVCLYMFFSYICVHVCVRLFTQTLRKLQERTQGPFKAEYSSFEISYFPSPRPVLWAARKNGCIHVFPNANNLIQDSNTGCLVHFRQWLEFTKLYIYIYIYVCVCVCVSVYVCICVCMCMCIWVCKCIFMYVCLYMFFSYICVHVCVRLFTQTLRKLQERTQGPFKAEYSSFEISCFPSPRPVLWAARKKWLHSCLSKRQQPYPGFEHGLPSPFPTMVRVYKIVYIYIYICVCVCVYWFFLLSITLKITCCQRAWMPCC